MIRTYLATFWRFYVLIFTPILLIPVLLHGLSSEKTYPDVEGLDANGKQTSNSNYEPMVCAYVLLLMAIYWMTAALPLAVTSLIPLVAFPLFGVLSTSEIAMNYMKATNFVMLGGLMLAVCVEHSGLHMRIALRIILVLGTSPRMVMFGFMVTTAFLSMFISNAATTAMMLPIVEAFALVMGNPEEESPDIEVGISALKRSQDFVKRRNLMLLSVAYAASIGGTGVITGTPSNLIILEVLPPESGVNFATWMSFTIPLMIVNLFLAWIWLLQMPRWMSSGRNQDKEENVEIQPILNDLSMQIAKRRDSCEKKSLKEIEAERHEQITQAMKHHYESMDPTSVHEWSILICFVVLIFLWFFREPIFIFGWGDYLKRITNRGNVSFVGDATPAILVAIFMFVLPTHYRFWPFQSAKLTPKQSPTLITWDIIEKKLPWGVLLFLGGGFALSDACTKTGFSTWLVQYLVALRGLPVWVINLIVSIITATTTEVVSNTATANVLLPILMEMSLTLCQNPTYFVLTSVITCCYAFMLPVATAPNAIVYQASSMTTSDMIKAGLPMNIICIITTNLAINTYGSLMFGMGTLSDWVIESAQHENITCTIQA